MPYRFSLFLFVLLSFQLNAGSIIKCRAPDGSITFADSLCPAGHTQLSKKSYKERRVKKQSTLKNLEKAAEFPADGKIPKIPRILFQAQFSQVLNSIAPIKISTIEYFMYRGRWPQTLEDLGFQPKEMTSSLIETTEMSKEGRISVKLKPEFGESKEVWLYPRLVMGGTQIEWDCFTNFPADLLQGVSGTPLCHSRYF